MNILQKIFGGKTSSIQPIQTQVSQDEIKSLEEDTTKLWNLIEETLIYYDSISCQCAFPRFRQYTSVDLSDYHATFYMSETEGFIHHCRPYFNVQKVDKGQECSRAIYTCKKCNSTYDLAWSDFSIRVNRSFLKLKKLKVIEVGAKEKTPIPFFIGLFGHSLPDPKLFERVDYETFKSYIRETKNGH